MAATVDTGQLEAKVKAMYRQVALAPDASFHFELGEPVALRVGYAVDRLATVPADALTREMHEELGVQIATGSVSHLCRLNAGRGGESVLLSAWLVGDWQGTPTNVAPDEHDEIRWFRPEELPPLAHELLGTLLVDAIRI